jgi:hypothetical protein
VTLRPGQTVPLGRGPALLRCLAGRIWLTVEGDARDYVLGAGEERTLEGDGRAVVQALGPAEIALCRRRAA